jgi:hypothetical protein
MLKISTFITFYKRKTRIKNFKCIAAFVIENIPKTHHIGENIKQIKVLSA